MSRHEYHELESSVYMNKDAIALKNKKQKLWKKYVLTRSMNDYNKFVKCKIYLRSLTRSLGTVFEKNWQIPAKTALNHFSHTSSPN